MASDSFKGGDKLCALLKQYSKNLEGKPTVSVGFFSGSTEKKSGLPSAYVALLNEYGGENTPPRPFFRSMIKDGEGHWGEDLGRYLESSQMSADNALTYIGEQMKEELKESIQLPRYAKLAQSTINKKGHSQTLIDTGDMLDAVSYQVDT